MKQKAKLWIWIVFSLVILGFAVFVYYAQQGKIIISADTATDTYKYDSDSDLMGIKHPSPDSRYTRCEIVTGGVVRFNIGSDMFYPIVPATGFNAGTSNCQYNVSGVYTTKAIPYESYQGKIANITFKTNGGNSSLWSLAIASAANGKVPTLYTPFYQSVLPSNNPFLKDDPAGGWYLIGGFNGSDSLGNVANAISKMPAGPIYVRYYSKDTYVNLDWLQLNFSRTVSPTASPSPTTSPAPTSTTTTATFTGGFTGSFDPTSVITGGKFTVKCDFGTRVGATIKTSNCINAKVSDSGATCKYTQFTKDASGKETSEAQFECTAGTKTGTNYSVTCNTVSGTSHNCPNQTKTLTPKLTISSTTPTPTPTPSEIPNLSAQSQCSVDGKTQVTLTWDRIPNVNVVEQDIYRYTTPTSDFQDNLRSNWILSYWLQTHDKDAIPGQYTCGDILPYKTTSSNDKCSYNCTATQCTYVDKNATGDTNKYRVRAWVTGTPADQHVQSDITTTCDNTDPDISDLRPENVLLTATGQTTATLSWDAVVGANGYDIYSCDGTLISATTQTSYDLVDLTCDTTYCYYVVARNDTSTSQSSDQASATTLTCGNGDDDDDGGGIDNVVKLISTGSNLWINILIALLMILGVGYFMFRNDLFHKKTPPTQSPEK